MPPIGELVFGLLLGVILGFMLRKSDSETKIRVGYIAAIITALVLYGAYDYYTDFAGLTMISGSFLYAVIGMIVGREIGRRIKRDNNNS